MSLRDLHDEVWAHWLLCVKGIAVALVSLVRVGTVVLSFVAKKAERGAMRAQTYTLAWTPVEPGAFRYSGGHR